MKKLLPYILILIALVGLFGFENQTNAQLQQHCYNLDGTINSSITTAADCAAAGFFWSTTPPTPTGGGTPPTPTNTTSYTFLAPLPCTGDAASGCSEGRLTTFDPTGTNKISEYLNIIIKLFIGICAVLAVIMIVVGGLQYMTTELVSSKEEGKKRITQAILGLVLAVGAWTLLYQINPDLLDASLDSLGKVEVEVALAEAIPSDTGTPPGVTSGCSAGVVKTQINMFACGDIVARVNAMLVASKNAGLNITGGGYRSEEQQKQLRIKNCKGDFKNAGAVCKPPTALPGQSNHNNGKAFDLQCDGVFIQTQDNKCFVWLKTNASTYGLYNLPSEPWHWSVDGR